MIFNRSQQDTYAEQIKIRRATTMAKGNVNKDYDVKYPNEVAEYAINKKVIDLTKRIKLSSAKWRKTVSDRRIKNAG